MLRNPARTLDNERASSAQPGEGHVGKLGAGFAVFLGVVGVYARHRAVIGVLAMAFDTGRSDGP